jgi:hypothetical protein
MYFDTADFAYTGRRNGHASRHKFRIRSYGAETGPPLFLELKGKYDCLGTSIVRQCPDRGWAKPWRPAPEPCAISSRGTVAATGWGCTSPLTASGKAVSSLVVDYRRTAFENGPTRTSGPLWIPGCAHGEPQERSPDGDSQGSFPSFSVLEIKFRYRLPSWFHRLAQNLDLDRVSFSKFHRAGEGFG